MSQSGSQESAELPARFVPEMSKEESLVMTIVKNMMVARIIMMVTLMMTTVKNMVVTRIVFMTLVKMTRISMIWSFPQGDVQQGESGCCGDDGDEYR